MQDFKNTRQAVIRYTRYLKRWSREFKRMEDAWRLNGFQGFNYTDQYITRCESHQNYIHKIVGTAFYEDTKEYNCFDNCLLAVSVPKYSIPMIPEWMHKIIE